MRCTRQLLRQAHTYPMPSLDCRCSTKRQGRMLAHVNPVLELVDHGCILSVA